MIFFLLISRHLNGSDMSNTSFWLRVALGSAVVAVLGFAIYRAIARLKWSTSSWAFFPLFHPSLKTKLSRPDPQEGSQETVHTSDPLQCLTSSLCPTFWVSWSQLSKGNWKLVITFSSLLCPAFSALYRPTRLSRIHWELFKSKQVLYQRGGNAGRLICPLLSIAFSSIIC